MNEYRLEPFGHESSAGPLDRPHAHIERLGDLRIASRQPVFPLVGPQQNQGEVAKVLEPFPQSTISCNRPRSKFVQPNDVLGIPVHDRPPWTVTRTNHERPVNPDRLRHCISAIETLARSHRAGKRVLVHCHVGTQRTRSVVAAYRVLVLGQSPTQAYAELSRYG